jgi:hypothetical protein
MRTLTGIGESLESDAEDAESKATSD